MRTCATRLCLAIDKDQPGWLTAYVWLDGPPMEPLRSIAHLCPACAQEIAWWLGTPEHAGACDHVYDHLKDEPPAWNALRTRYTREDGTRTLAEHVRLLLHNPTTAPQCWIDPHRNIVG